MSYSPSGGGLRNGYWDESELQSLWWSTEEQLPGGERVTVSLVED